MPTSLKDDKNSLGGLFLWKQLLKVYGKKANKVAVIKLKVNNLKEIERQVKRVQEHIV